MYLSTKASRVRQLEAEHARRNRLEIVKALSHGQITRRDLFKWGIFTTTGALAYKNGLSPYAPSAYAQVPTGAPRSPLYGAAKFTQKLPRAVLQKPINMVPVANNEYAFQTPGGLLVEPPARERSYHDLFTASGGTAYYNPVTGRGPMEGRPPGEFFAHQRWADSDFHPTKGYLLSLGQVKSGSKFHPSMPHQDKNSVWSFGERSAGHVGSRSGSRLGSATPLLLQMRYYEPVICRIYNDLPESRTDNGGFGRNEISTHFHNSHNGAESDGACNAYHFPGTFYDYHWKGACARHDMPDIREINAPRYADRCSAPNDTGGITLAQGDFRELQGSMWFHDHRFFFTAENVHKGNFSLANMYSGPDRGCDTVEDGINLRLPSGNLNGKGWGNLDFDVNLAISNPAFNAGGQLFFDIFDTDGFLGDVLAVNGAYAPYMEVLPRRYRFRTLNASMARFIKLCLSVESSTRFAKATKVPVYVISNDGNLLVRPVRLTDFDVQGVAERFDFVVDFSQFAPGDLINLVNVLRQVDGRKPDRALSLGEALRGDSTDPTVGAFMQFKVVSELTSYDDPTKTLYSSDPDNSANLGAGNWSNGTNKLTWQIPIVQPARVRTIEFGRSGSGDSRDNPGGQCIPECGDIEAFPWTIKINGQAAHSLNANRISALIPKPGEVEHWVLVNGGGGWDHPIHLHFEEGVTIDRAGDPIHATEKLARKDVWRLGSSGKRTVRIQVRFGEFGGAYVAHCHNTTHEDFAMLMRYQVLSDGNTPQRVPTSTPIPSPDGITWKKPEILLEGDPRPRLAAR